MGPSYNRSYTRNKFNENYALGWKEANETRNHLMISLKDENLYLKIENQKLKTIIEQIRGDKNYD